MCRPVRKTRVSKHAKSDLMADLHRRVYPQTPAGASPVIHRCAHGRTIWRDIRRLPAWEPSVDLSSRHSSSWSASGCWRFRLLLWGRSAADTGRLATERISGGAARDSIRRRSRGRPAIAELILPPSLGEAVLAAAEGTVAFVGSIAGKPVISIDHGSVRTTYEPVDQHA